MDDVATTFLTVASLLFVGLAAEALGRRGVVPRVTILLVVGFVAGPGGLDLLPSETESWFPIVTQLALVMIGFLIGAEFTASALRAEGGPVVTIAIVQSVVTAGVVAAALFAVGAEAALALTLAGIAVATDPAATVAVIHEQGTRGPLTRTVMAVVALDDVIALALFSVLTATAVAVSGVDGGGGIVGNAVWEVVGGVLIGGVLGIAAAGLTGRLRPGEPTREEAYGFVLLCAGLSIWLEVSFILAAVVMGSFVANMARHHERPFREIESIEWPFLTIFFFLAGAELAVDQVSAIGLIGVVYLVARVVGKVTGGWVGSRAGRRIVPGALLGWSLLPQAGVALGLSLQVADRFPDVADDVIAIVVVATVVFELLGPVLTRWALNQAGEMPDDVAESGRRPAP